MPRTYGPKSEWKIPADARLLESTNGWLIYHSPGSGRLFIYPGEYHAEALPFLSQDLKRWLAALEQSIPHASRKPSEEPDIPH
ncbi:MAG: hypothetical protein KGJ08_07400 [Gammaproteobacteria bacterium]|nr:hypothetical protein [Gammaproteobacteria bacterium]